MALSFKEKREIQRSVQKCLKKLHIDLDFRTKCALQRRVEENFAKLMEAPDKKERTLDDRQMAGEI